MRTSTWMRRHAPWPAAVGLLLTACAGVRPADDSTPANAAAAPAAVLPGGAEGLPAGEGRGILLTSCTDCHDLEGLWAYQGYYDAARWRGLVETMIAHGAELDQTETDDLVDYLVRHFGPGTR